MAGVRVGVGETSELGSRAGVAGVRVGKVEEGEESGLGSGAVVVVVVRVGNVEEGDVGELGSGAVVMVVRVGNVEEVKERVFGSRAVVARDRNCVV